MSRILIDNRQRKKRLNLSEISRIASRVLNLLDEKNTELSLAFVNNREMAILNRRYLSSPGTTDVLAFPMGANPVRSSHQRCGSRLRRNGTYLLGDVVISIEKTSSQARKWKEPFKKELIRLIIHGILHLVGYRDKKKSDRIKMFNLQEKILSIVYETA